MDEAKQHEVRSWLTKALQDLHSGLWLLDSPYELYHAVGFHCQQAIEKALKAYLTWHDEPFEKTHSLVALIGKCLSFDVSFETLRQAATVLTPYAIASRYPGDLPVLTRAEAQEDIRLAQQVWEFITMRLPKEVQPRE